MRRVQRWLDIQAHPAYMRDKSTWARVRCDPGIISRQWSQEFGGYPRWALPMNDLGRDVIYAWWSSHWWPLAVGRAYGAVMRLAVRSGVWGVKDGDYYRNGWLQFPDMWTRFDRGNA